MIDHKKRQSLLKRKDKTGLEPQKMTPHNSIMGFILVILLLTSQILSAQDRPVYLKPNNPAPTGHFDLKLLERRALAYDQFEWLWVRDSLGHNGWMLKSSALLPLDFSRQAILAKGESVYMSPKEYELPQKTLEQSQVVTLVERFRDWYKVIYKNKNANAQGWVRDRTLSPYSKDGGFFYSMTDTYLRQAPQMKAKILKKIDAGVPIIPLNTKDSWALVIFNGQRGYIPMTQIKSRMDIAIKVRTEKGYFKPHPDLYQSAVLEIFANPIWVGTGAFSVELKEKPDMGSKTVAVVKPWQSLAQQGYSIKKWGKSKIPQWGELWWPESTIESNVEIIRDRSIIMTKINKSEIYQIEKSPVVKDLQFASAVHGVYRSFDGSNWYPLASFKNAHPIKVAKNGTLFVGDQVSFDHGESFQHFIRWDKVFETLPSQEQLSKGPVQLLNVEPHSENPKQVTLSLRVGSNKYMQFYTPDFGKNWRLR